MISRAIRVAPLAACILAATTMISSAAFAHEGAGMAGGFVSGLTHPLFGLDHVVAMVAVGLWGAFLGRPALYLLPIIFPVVMAFGGALGVLGFPLPGVEIGIAGSAIVLGLLVALAARPPIWIASCLVGAFAIFHGYAHGAELPHAANAITYSIGFVLSTGMLHLVGIAFGMLVKMPSGRIAVRGLGVAISLVGVAFMTGIA
jgi:urease accessory protein